tara:strand:- start:2671 stop:3429 length:759 start_codon:yes stop_codon:yes gene_type:complete
MIDSHCHLDHEPISSNINDIIDRCKSVGLEKVLSISTTHNSYNNILKLIKIDPMIYGSIGIHPHETSKEKMKVEFIINEFKKYNKIIGVGETGLDFYYENSDRKSQISSFIDHIEASIKLNCPLIIHSRSAEHETFEILNKYKNKNLKILMHCFTGSKNFAEKLNDLDAYFSASGIITFKNSEELRETFRNLPQNRILIETDSPFLAPVPMRGKKNEPSFIKYTLEAISNIKNIDFKRMDEITTKNFNNLFF